MTTGRCRASSPPCRRTRCSWLPRSAGGMRWTAAGRHELAHAATDAAYRPGGCAGIGRTPGRLGPGAVACSGHRPAFGRQPARGGGALGRRAGPRHHASPAAPNARCLPRRGARRRACRARARRPRRPLCLAAPRREQRVSRGSGARARATTAGPRPRPARGPGSGARQRGCACRPTRAWQSRCACRPTRAWQSRCACRPTRAGQTVRAPGQPRHKTCGRAHRRLAVVDRSGRAALGRPQRRGGRGILAPLVADELRPDRRQPQRHPAWPAADAADRSRPMSASLLAAATAPAPLAAATAPAPPAPRTGLRPAPLTDPPYDDELGHPEGLGDPEIGRDALAVTLPGLDCALWPPTVPASVRVPPTVPAAREPAPGGGTPAPGPRAVMIVRALLEVLGRRAPAQPAERLGDTGARVRPRPTTPAQPGRPARDAAQPPGQRADARRGRGVSGGPATRTARQVRRARAPHGPHGGALGRQPAGGRLARPSAPACPRQRRRGSPWHRLYLRPEPQGHASLRPGSPPVASTSPSPSGVPPSWTTTPPSPSTVGAEYCSTG